MKIVKVLFLVVLIGCTTPEPVTYKLETLNSNIENFSREDRNRLVSFSSEYEKKKSLYDSISGVPVVLTESLTYEEILEYIASFERGLFLKDSIRYATVKSLVLDISPIDFEGLGVEIWSVDESFLTNSNIMLEMGRNFSSAYPSDSLSVIVSKDLAARIDVQIGEEVIGKKVVGILGSLGTTYPKEELLLLLVLKQ